MVYVAGIAGFIFGFFVGLMALSFLLRDTDKEDLLNDPYIKWKYGILNWIFAILGAYIAVFIFQRAFG